MQEKTEQLDNSRNKTLQQRKQPQQENRFDLDYTLLKHKHTKRKLSEPL
jgi:hypothetical protein